MRRAFAFACLAVAACGGDSTGPGPSPEPVASVKVSPAADTIIVGANIALTATSLDASGKVLAGRPVTWSLDDSSLATISAGGLLSGTGIGAVTATATAASGPSGSARIRLIPKVSIARRYPTTFVGDTTVVVAHLTTISGASLAGSVVWRSSSSAIATIQSDGVATGVAAGTVWLVADTPPAADSVALVVLPRPAPRADRDVAFVIGTGGEGTLVTLMPDGSGLTQVSAADETMDSYAWSPNGSRLVVRAWQNVFLAPAKLYVMNADGSGRQLVSEDAIRPRWSPDGTRIAFRTGAGDIGVVNADGSGFHLITSFAGDELNPEWSPDGRQIGYREGDCQGLSLINVDGSDHRHIDLPIGMCNLKWSPDGKSIAFDARGAIGSAPSVWVVNSDGTNPHPVSGNCAGAVCSGTSWGDPFWSPDGSILGFSRMYATNAVRLYRMSGGQVTDLTLGGASIHLDGWSPSGTKLLYETVDASDNGQALGVMATDGGFPVTFSPDTALFMPSWRP